MKSLSLALVAIALLTGQAMATGYGDNDYNTNINNNANSNSNAASSVANANALADATAFSQSGAVATSYNAQGQGQGQGQQQSQGQGQGQGQAITSSGNAYVSGISTGPSNATASNAGNNNAASGNTTTVVTEAQKRNPVNTAYAAPLTAAEDTCMGSTTAGAQGIGFGLSLGSTYQDEDCVRRKDARELHNMNHRGAAIALMCQSENVRTAMEQAGDNSCKGVVDTESSYIPVVSEVENLISPAKPVKKVSKPAVKAKKKAPCAYPDVRARERANQDYWTEKLAK